MDRYTTVQRAPISTNKSIQVWRKTEGLCWYCGKDFKDRMTIDHVQPVSQGGSDELDNLVPCCKSCNSAKGGRSVDEYRLVIQRKKGMILELKQIMWLYSKGIEVPDPDPCLFYFETHNLKEHSND